MTSKRKLTLPGNRNHKKGGSKKTSWIWNLMEPIEIINSNGAIFKNALCKVNISETKLIGEWIHLYGGRITKMNTQLYHY